MHAVFRIRVNTQQDRDRVLPRLFRNALNGTIAIFYPPRAGNKLELFYRPRPGNLFYVAPIHQHYYQSVAMQDPDRIIGVYRNTGDPVALLEALMEDLRDAAARLA